MGSGFSSFSHKSPQEILAASGNAKTGRQRNVGNSLLDFLECDFMYELCMFV